MTENKKLRYYTQLFNVNQYVSDKDAENNLGHNIGHFILDLFRKSKNKKISIKELQVECITDPRITTKLLRYTFAVEQRFSQALRKNRDL